MSLRAFLLKLLLPLLAILAGTAHADDFWLSGNENGVTLPAYHEMLVDESGKFGPADLAEAERAHRFVKYEQLPLNFGYSRSAFWLKVVLVNPTTQEHQIDWERSALVNGLVPAQFTVAEDNRTYDLSGQAGPLMEILQILKANGVPLNRMVDIRSNPGLRAQIQAVVRRAAEQQAPAAQPAAGAPAAAPDQPSIAERLQELETLRASGALTDDEYNSRRAQIISEI